MLDQKTLEILCFWPTDLEIRDAIKIGFHQASELAEILAMKKKPESVTYFSSKNGLQGIYDDNDTIFNGFNNENNQDNIQEEQLELSAALSISASEVSLIASDNLQNTDDILSPNCRSQLIALQKENLFINYNSKNSKF